MWRILLLLLLVEVLLSLGEWWMAWIIGKENLPSVRSSQGPFWDVYFWGG